MSGIAAIIRFDGGPATPGAIEAMTGAMAYRGRDGIAHWCQGPVALGHCALHTTAESLEQAQPVTSEDGRVVLAMAGFLMNPAELRSELLSCGAVLRNRSDAELVLRAYEAWGEECPKRIDGEYAFVVWDGRRGSAFCARDHAGLRPLHYHWDGKRLLVASDPGAILAAGDVAAIPNTGMIAEIMANEWITPGETIWQGIGRLLPATWMRFSSQGPASSTYWTPPLEVTLTYQRDEDYQAHYRDLLDDCVRRAARSHLPVACDVSGGLDSSAVFAVAHDLRRRGELPAPEIKGYTYLCPAGTEADELEYARAVAAHVGAPMREIPPFLADLDWFRDYANDVRDMAPYANTAMAVSVGQALLADGCRVSLNGEGGDEWLGGKSFYYSEQIAGLDFGDLALSLREDIAAIGLGQTLHRLLRYGLAPLTPRPLRALRRRLFPQTGPNTFRSAFWLSSGMRAELAGRRQAVAGAQFHRIGNVARRAMFMMLQEVYCGLARDQYDRQCAWVGYESRSPMYARQFIEFAFSTPERIRLRGDRRKHIHVTALKGLLPDNVLQRKDKADFSLAFEHYLDKMRNEFEEVLAASRTGLLDLRGARKLYQCYLDWPRDIRPVWELWGVLACECVLTGRSLNHGQHLAE